MSDRWPRLLPEKDAAEYVGVSLSQFRMEVEKGLWPKPVARGCRRNTYDRMQLDAAVDKIVGPLEEGGELERRLNG